MKTLFHAIYILIFVLLASVTSFVVPDALAAPSPVASYSFDDNTGTQALDASGNANTGTVSNGAWTATAKYGKAITFNGTSSRVTINDSASLDLTTGMTLEAWVRPTALSGWRSIIIKERGNALSYSLYANTNNNKPFGEIMTPIDQYIEAGNKLPLNTWTHVATTFDGTQLRLFVNGTQVGSKITTGSIVSSSDSLRIGSNAIWGEYFKGQIDEVRIYNSALSASEIQADMSTPIGAGITPPPSDTQAPTVSMSTPANNATVSGTNTTVSATATDNIGVAGVQFKLNNVNLGLEDTSAPFSISWNTTNTPNGQHTLTAIARDQAGNQTTSSQIVITVSNTVTDPRATTGEWSQKQNWPIVAVHSVLMPNGKVLIWDAWTFPTPARVWNPQNGAFTDVTNVSNPDGIFCAGQNQLADGRLLIAGGHDQNNDGTTSSIKFDSSNYSWPETADMNYRRWYPSTVTLSDGRVVAISGSTRDGGFADKPEIYSPATNTWTILNVSTASMHDTQYPLGYLLPNGKVYVISATNQQLHQLDIANNQWNNLGQAPMKQGSAAMYRPGKLLYTGGEDPQSPGNSGRKASVIDLTSGTGSWRTIANMSYPRYQHNLTVMADGRVFAVGGSKQSNLGSTQGTLQAEVWDPESETWSNAGTMQDPRMYHSTSLLLPDGRIMIAGGGKFGTVTDYRTAEIYSPSYLFKGARPVIQSASSDVGLGGTITISTTNAQDISKVSFVRLPSVSHTIDFDQRYMELSFTKSTNSLSATIPANGNIVPPGYYMVFILNSNGVPSESKMVKVTGDGAPTITPSPTVTPTVSPTPPVSVTPPPTTSPIAAYNFNEGTGTTLNDVSGNNNTGAISGATWNSSGKFGGALAFDGVGNYVTVNDSPSLRLTTGMTLEAWIYPYFLSDWRNILMKQRTGNLSYSLYAHTYLNQPSVEIATGGGNSEAQGTSILPLNTWTHIASTYDGASLKFYVNGTLVTTKSVTGLIVTTSDPLRIGGNSVWGEYFSGLIDDVRIHNTALSQLQIQADMNTGL